MRDFMEAKKRFLWNVLYMYILIEWCREIRVILSRYWCVEENWRILFLLDLSDVIDGTIDIGCCNGRQYEKDRDFGEFCGE